MIKPSRCFAALSALVKQYWAQWFPDLPSHEKLAKRVNFLSPAFVALFDLLVGEGTLDEGHRDHLMDSMPIIVANGQRSGNAKAADGLCDKGYCSSKKMYYCGVKQAYSELGLHESYTIRPRRNIHESDISHSETVYD